MDTSDGELEEKGESESERECETLRCVMSGSVLGIHGLNWDTGPIHITASKNRWLCSRGRANIAGFS